MQSAIAVLARGTDARTLRARLMRLVAARDAADGAGAEVWVVDVDGEGSTDRHGLDGVANEVWRGLPVAWLREERWLAARAVDLGVVVWKLGARLEGGWARAVEKVSCRRVDGAGGALNAALRASHKSAGGSGQAIERDASICKEGGADARRRAVAEEGGLVGEQQGSALHEHAAAGRDTPLARGGRGAVGDGRAGERHVAAEHQHAAAER